MKFFEHNVKFQDLPKAVVYRSRVNDRLREDLKLPLFI